MTHLAPPDFIGTEMQHDGLLKISQMVAGTFDFPDAINDILSNCYYEAQQNNRGIHILPAVAMLTLYPHSYFAATPSQILDDDGIVNQLYGLTKSQIQTMLCNTVLPRSLGNFYTRQIKQAPDRNQGAPFIGAPPHGLAPHVTIADAQGSATIHTYNPYANELNDVSLRTFAELDNVAGPPLFSSHFYEIFSKLKPWKIPPILGIPTIYGTLTYASRCSFMDECNAIILPVTTPNQAIGVSSYLNNACSINNFINNTVNIINRCACRAAVTRANAIPIHPNVVLTQENYDNSVICYQKFSNDVCGAISTARYRTFHYSGLNAITELMLNEYILSKTTALGVISTITINNMNNNLGAGLGYYSNAIGFAIAYAFRLITPITTYELYDRDILNELALILYANGNATQAYITSLIDNTFFTSLSQAINATPTFNAAIKKDCFNIIITAYIILSSIISVTIGYVINGDIKKYTSSVMLYIYYLFLSKHHIPPAYITTSILTIVTSLAPTDTYTGTDIGALFTACGLPNLTDTYEVLCINGIMRFTAALIVAKQAIAPGIAHMLSNIDTIITHISGPLLLIKRFGQIDKTSLNYNSTILSYATLYYSIHMYDMANRFIGGMSGIENGPHAVLDAATCVREICLGYVESSAIILYCNSNSNHCQAICAAIICRLCKKTGNDNGIENHQLFDHCSSIISIIFSPDIMTICNTHNGNMRLFKERIFGVQNTIPNQPLFGIALPALSLDHIEHHIFTPDVLFYAYNNNTQVNTVFGGPGSLTQTHIDTANVEFSNRYGEIITFINTSIAANIAAFPGNLFYPLFGAVVITECNPTILLSDTYKNSIICSLNNLMLLRYQSIICGNETHIFSIQNINRSATATRDASNRAIGQCTQLQTILPPPQAHAYTPIIGEYTAIVAAATAEQAMATAAVAQGIMGLTPLDPNIGFHGLNEGNNKYDHISGSIISIIIYILLGMLDSLGLTPVQLANYTYNVSEKLSVFEKHMFLISDALTEFITFIKDNPHGIGGLLKTNVVLIMDVCTLGDPSPVLKHASPALKPQWASPLNIKHVYKIIRTKTVFPCDNIMLLNSTITLTLRAPPVGSHPADMDNVDEIWVKNTTLGPAPPNTILDMCTSSSAAKVKKRIDLLHTPYEKLYHGQIKRAGDHLQIHTAKYLGDYLQTIDNIYTRTINSMGAGTWYAADNRISFGMNASEISKRTFIMTGDYPCCCYASYNKINTIYRNNYYIHPSTPAAHKFKMKTLFVCYAAN